MARKSAKLLTRSKSVTCKPVRRKPKPCKPKSKAKKKLTTEQKANMRIYNKKYRARKSEEPGWLAAQCAAVKVKLINNTSI